ncbi:MAG: hypothetical protein MPJ50_09085, partial [Pirellulales bacterium]|nr:hypothetical protein [Pirellulales bacterium]
QRACSPETSQNLTNVNFACTREGKARGEHSGNSSRVREAMGADEQNADPEHALERFDDSCSARSRMSLNTSAVSEAVNVGDRTATRKTL